MPADDPQECIEIPMPARDDVETINRLRREANSWQHLMRHMPKNPFCRACQTAKAQRAQARRPRMKASAQHTSMDW